MSLDGANQAVLISGESGAGKTEATKHCLAFLAEMAGSENAVEGQVLQANPILEAFGNAKTLRNNNSSRFGKWIELHFATSGAIASAKIDQYLLEKARVPRAAQGERSYHIFYQVCSGLYDQSFGLKHAGQYKFLQASGCYEVAGIDDADDLQSTLKSFSGLDFSQEEVDGVIAMTAGVLLLGNLEFERDGEGSKVSKSSGALVDVARLWGVTAEALHTAVTIRTIEVRGTTTEIPLKMDEAPETCAAFAMSAYKILFGWLVTRINSVLDGPRGKLIGILDIFGFEIFETNGFEQMCINYCNEKLQQFFNENTFKQEEQLYEAEGVKYDHVTFIDNQPVLNLIEKKPAGLFALLDDEVVIPKGSDEGFIQNLATRFKDNTLVVVFKPNEEKKTGVPVGFTIQHYAGEVRYRAAGFLDKDRDAISPDLNALMYTSTMGVIKDHVFPKPRGFKRSPATRTTLASQFKGQLNTLMETLRTTAPHFIRCIKPNPNKKKREFTAPMVLEQLRYSGVFEAVTIRKSGYPFRHRLDQFVGWYKCLLLDPSDLRHFRMRPFTSPDLKERVAQILAATGQDFSGVQYGHTMVLYRAKEHRTLELLRNLTLEQVVPFLQRTLRGGLARELKRRLLVSRKLLRHAIDSAELINQLDATLQEHVENMGAMALLFAIELREIGEIKRLRAGMQLWADLEVELRVLLAEDAKGGDAAEAVADALEVAVLRAEEIKHVRCNPQQRALFEQARAALDKHAARRLNPQAEEALWVLDKAKMNLTLSEARRLAYSSPDIEKITELLALPEDKFVELQLKKAVELQDPTRVINRTIRLRNLHLEKHASMFQPHLFPRLRAPAEFAGSKVFRLASKAKELQEGMMYFSRAPMPMSLTELEPALNKEATQLFKCLLMYSGERPTQYPPAMALQVLQAGVAQPDLCAEIYMQLIKQLRCNPSTDSQRRYWELMALCLMAFAPGAGCDGFVHVFCKQNVRTVGRNSSLCYTLCSTRAAGPFRSPPTCRRCSPISSGGRSARATRPLRSRNLLVVRSPIGSRRRYSQQRPPVAYCRSWHASTALRIRPRLTSGRVIRSQSRSDATTAGGWASSTAKWAGFSTQTCGLDDDRPADFLSSASLQDRRHATVG